MHMYVLSFHINPISKGSTLKKGISSWTMSSEYVPGPLETHPACNNLNSELLYVTMYVCVLGYCDMLLFLVSKDVLLVMSFFVRV